MCLHEFPHDPRQPRWGGGRGATHLAEVYNRRSPVRTETKTLVAVSLCSIEAHHHHSVKDIFSGLLQNFTVCLEGRYCFIVQALSCLWDVQSLQRSMNTIQDWKAAWSMQTVWNPLPFRNQFFSLFFFLSRTEGYVYWTWSPKLEASLWRLWGKEIVIVQNKFAILTRSSTVMDGLEKSPLWVLSCS